MSDNVAVAFTPLNALNAFLAVGRRRSFARAAADLGVSASALSQSVRQLEARLGVTLLRRTSRSVALTDEGQRLLEGAGPAVDQALESLKAVSARPGEVTGTLKLSAPSASGSLVLAKFLPGFVAKHPKVEVEVRAEDRFVDIVAERVDAGIRFVEAIQKDMVHVRLTEPGRFVVAGSPDYLRRRGVPKTPKELLEHDCIGLRSMTTGSRYAWELEKGKKEWRVAVQGPVTTNDVAFMRLLAIAGVGLFYTYEPFVETDLRQGKLRVVLEDYAPEVPGLFLYYPSRAQVSPALRAFVAHIRELVGTARARR